MTTVNGENDIKSSTNHSAESNGSGITSVYPNLKHQDIERGLHQPTKTSEYTNGHEVKASTKTIVEDDEPSRSSVYLRRSLKAIGSLIVIGGAAFVIYYFDNWLFWMAAIFVALVLVIIITGFWRWLHIAAVTAPRDIRALTRFIGLLLFVKKLARKDASIAEMFEEQCKKTPNKACMIFEGRSWTFKEVNDFKNRIANVFFQNGFKHGDKVGLLMENRPEFVATWLGLSQLGIVIPLINHNLKKQTLLHSITIGNCNGLIYEESLKESIEEIRSEIPANIALYQFNDNAVQPVLANSKDLQTLLTQVSGDPPPANKIKKPGHHDELLYIYTSGTTGLPKAAVITHSRYIYIVSAIRRLAVFRDNDIFYSPLPLYHTACGIMAIGQMMLHGSTVVIRKKFSASAYFAECAQHNATVAQYIGEMARYCLSAPAQPTDTSHKLRMVFGNGLRPQVWPQFIKRFNLKWVCEFYGATEGNANIVNITNVVGAIGFISRIIPIVYPISIIKADPDTGEPIRGRNGLCQQCKPNEPGVFIGKIIPNNPSRAFLGYVDKKASDKKIVRNVFSKGDSAFLSGDLLSADVRGNLFFVDRTGDTFRWKGENCSTCEIEAQVSNEAGYRDCVVYGVEIVNMEGRAGMAAILDPEATLSLQQLSVNLRKALPSYARPQFVRILEEIDMTGTYKLKKVDLQKEGFDPNVIKDKLYYLNTRTGEYEPLTVEIYAKILNQEIRF